MSLRGTLRTSGASEPSELETFAALKDRTGRARNGRVGSASLPGPALPAGPRAGPWAPTRTVHALARELGPPSPVLGAFCPVQPGESPACTGLGFLLCAGDRAFQRETGVGPGQSRRSRKVVHVEP